ncbi:hypothetical protein MTP99_015359 [Tenebrio molitor]|nr:hypothetical protein MTP99_015359 [Tenebrio molitor]
MVIGCTPMPTLGRPRDRVGSLAPSETGKVCNSCNRRKGKSREERRPVAVVGSRFWMGSRLESWRNVREQFGDSGSVDNGVKGTTQCRTK